MPPVTFETFDPTPYQRAPRGNVRGILSLARSLAELAPRDQNETVARTADGLDEVIAVVADGLTIRRRESVPTDLSDGLAVDGCADTLWAVVRNGLEAKASFAHPGLAVVLAQHGKRSAVATAIKEGQAQAARARTLASKLFGSEGLAFTQQAYPVQSESMGEIIRLIDEDGLAPELDALLGPHVLVALRACQAEYETMVDGRMSRDDRKSTDLSRLRGKLQRAISRYCSAVLTLLDESKPATLPLVLTALRPLEVHRAQLATPGKTTGPDNEAGDDEDDDESLAGGSPAAPA
jgi:hypothetical protein